MYRNVTIAGLLGVLIGSGAATLACGGSDTPEPEGNRLSGAVHVVGAEPARADGGGCPTC